jgi:hypothetical protein
MFRHRQWLYAEAMAGRLPAEVLDTAQAERLVKRLIFAGWADVEIATHTKWSTYTVTRIRERIGMPLAIDNRFEEVA